MKYLCSCLGKRGPIYAHFRWKKCSANPTYDWEISNFFKWMREIKVVIHSTFWEIEAFPFHWIKCFNVLLYIWFPIQWLDYSELLLAFYAEAGAFPRKLGRSASQARTCLLSKFLWITHHCFHKWPENVFITLLNNGNQGRKVINLASLMIITLESVSLWLR